MHKIDSPNAVSGQFATNAGLSGQDPTYLTPEWCNAVQDELINVIQAAGIAPSKPDNAQLLDALSELFYTKSQIATLIESERAAERDRLYPVGKGTYIAYDSSNPASHLGFGVWQLIGKGQALVGLSDVSGHPAWTKTVGSTFGEYEHTLTVDEIPGHQHGQRADSDGGANQPQVTNSSGGVDGLRGQTDPASTGKTQVMTDSAGGGLAHNNVQPSFVVAIWLRVA